MLQQYLNLVKKALEKLPFFNYINRLIAYIKTPELTDSDSSTEQLEHSLLDVFNALGLVIVVSVGFTLYSTDFGYMNAYKIFNPLFLAFTYVTYGAFFALVIAISCWGLSKTPLFSNDAESGSLIYKVFCHSLRFYAATGLFLGTLAVHATGVVVTEGIKFETAFEHWGLMLAIIVTLIWFPFRLYVNPLFKYLSPIKLNVIGYLLILMAIYLTTTLNQALPISLSDRMLVKEESCKLFKSGNLYKNTASIHKPEIEKIFCKLGEN